MQRGGSAILVPVLLWADETQTLEERWGCSALLRWLWLPGEKGTAPHVAPSPAPFPQTGEVAFPALVPCARVSLSGLPSSCMAGGDSAEHPFVSELKLTGPRGRLPFQLTTLSPRQELTLQPPGQPTAMGGPEALKCSHSLLGLC